MSVKRVLVYGGKGALGSCCVKYFKQNGYWVGNIDMLANDEADVNVTVSNCDSWVEQHHTVSSKVAEIMGEHKLDAIMCVAGGWAGGNAAHHDFIGNSDLMWKQSVWTSSIAAHLATKYLITGGVLTLTGAHAALHGTEGMIGYGMAKAAVHQLTKSLAKSGSGLPDNSLVIAILPVTLDTPMNRKWMPKADFSSWTPLEFVAKLFYDWCEGRTRPESGCLVQLITKEGNTQLINV